ncbi:phosphatase PAP2 family protein [Lusitaniella coriacea]|uniref:phosphatase PAP2 family protein n=1 Tax=Lusitaniella coriacea TaxID=1983105 RepID=UPI001D13E643|nr:phosphatase PAP2 family protein [Lusitaniella coriacea]
MRKLKKLRDRGLIKNLIKNWSKKRRSIQLSYISILLLCGFAIAGLALWGFWEIAENVFSQETQTLDTAVSQAVYAIHTPWLTQIAIAATTLGEPVLLFALSIMMSVALLFRRQWIDAIAWAVNAIGATGLNFWLKHLFARDRPALWERIVEVDFYSFPSGHAMISLAIYGFLGYWLAKRFPARWKLIASLTTILIFAIGFSRLYLGVHWLTDIAAGYAAGLVWLMACLLGMEMAHSRYLKR